MNRLARAVAALSARVALPIPSTATLHTSAAAAGRGDARTKAGKRFKGSNGKARPKAPDERPKLSTQRAKPPPPAEPL